jgi:hypothetical protein
VTQLDPSHSKSLGEKQLGASQSQGEPGTQAAGIQPEDRVSNKYPRELLPGLSSVCSPLCDHPLLMIKGKSEKGSRKVVGFPWAEQGSYSHLHKRRYQ